MRKADWDEQTQIARHEREFAPPAGYNDKMANSMGSH
jgi:hypothetical protein